MNTPAARDWPHRASELGQLLPTGFVMGAAASAFQIEGASRDGGRSESIWDVFSARRGRIRDGSNASVAADHLARYREDVQLLRDLGADAYSFSLSWSRLQPDARGSLNRTGLAFYDQLLDALLAAGIRPRVTLAHWDLPAALRGGWMNRDTAGRFGDYAHAVGAALADRVDSWVTLHEPATVAVNGYAVGTHAPGHSLLFEALPAVHHQLLGHGLAVQGLRAADVRAPIGIVNAHSPVESASDRDEDRSYADLVDLLYNHAFSDPVLLGHYPAPLEPFGVELRPLLEADPADLRTIHQPLDFYGVSYAQPTRIKAGQSPATKAALAAARAAAEAGEPAPVAAPGDWPRLPFHCEQLRERPQTGAGAAIAPDAVAETLARLQGRYGTALPPIYLQVGAGFADPVPVRGAVPDPVRIDYLAEHMLAALGAVAPNGAAAGVDLRGVFVRSLLDGFEWDAGYSERYGLVHVAFADSARVGTRTPKQSFRWLQNVLAQR
ncbi:MAG: family 1 glycosylhydrolase [Cryobacterium sp.]